MKKNEEKKNTLEFFKKAAKFALRWFYLIGFVVSLAYAFWVWDKYIIKADWSEDKKQRYIQEQSVFSFDRKNYEKAVDVMMSKKEKMENGEKYNGRDVFFPEGF